MKNRKNKMLIDLRTTNDLTQQEVADETGISRSLYSLIETGRRNGSRVFWMRIQALYGLPDAVVWEMMKNEAAEPQKVHNPAC